MPFEKILYHLTEPQKRIWYTQMIYPDSSMYNIGGAAFIEGAADLEVLEKAICIFVNSHDAFKIRLLVQEDQPKQYFCQQQYDSVEAIDLSNKVEPALYLKKICDRKARESFELEDSPLFEFFIFKLSNEQSGYIAKIHHIIADGWSLQILAHQISGIYEQLLDEKSDFSPQQPSYKDFIHNDAEYLLSQKYSISKHYWSEQFEQLPEQMPPLSNDIDGHRIVKFLNKVQSDKIKAFCDRFNITLNTFFISLYLIYKFKVTETRDVTIGVPVVGRSGKIERNTFGIFVNTMPFRFFMNRDETILDVMQRVSKLLMLNYKHQKYPYNHLIKDINLAQKGYDRLFEVCINYYGTQLSNDISGFPVYNQEFYNGQQEYPLQIIIRDWLDDKGLQLDFDYKISEYTHEKIMGMSSHLELLIDLILRDERKQVSDFLLLTEDEKQRMVFDYNKTNTDHRNDKSIIDLFEEQVELTPDRVAIECGTDSLTYNELNQRSNQLAAHLKSKGVANHVIVALLTKHSLETVIGILGILKAGGAYLAIDPNYPKERILFSLKDARVNILLSNLDHHDFSFAGEIIQLTGELYSNTNIKENINDCRLNDLAYVLYTSGSTGNPKGVMVKHHNLVNYINWARKTYVTEQQEMFALYSSVAFDLTITSIFTPLVSGGMIIVYPDVQDSYIFESILKNNNCTILKLTPSHLQLLKNYDNRNSRVNKLIVGGENLKADLAMEVYESFGGKIEIYNEYGPTEATIGCMYYKFDPKSDKFGAVPIGKPIDNTYIYILDQKLNPSPMYVSNELYISGSGVASGYLNQPVLTEEKFIKDPFVKDGVMYKTGDLAKFIDFNTIVYEGRRDDQIKIRGYRIEPGEIEKTIQLYNKNIQNVAIVMHNKQEEAKFLCAYYVSDQSIDENDLRQFLLSHLPNYMIPAFYVHVERIPLTINGKIDKGKLPYPTKSGNKNLGIKSYHENEAVLLNTISNVLGLPSVNIDDNYFLLGGDSIKAILISSRLNEDNYTLKVKDILTYPVLGEMVAFMKKRKQKNVSQKACTGTVPHTPIVKWFFSNDIENKDQYCQSVQLKFNNKVPIKILSEMLGELVKHHDMLRLNYDAHKNTLYFNNEYLTQDIPIEEWDFSEMDSNQLSYEVNRVNAKLISTIKIDSELILRSAICHTRDGMTWIIVVHHLAIDGVSWRIILEDIQTMLRQNDLMEKFSLPLKTNSYQEWANFLQHYKISNDFMPKEVKLQNLYNKNKASYGKEIHKLVHLLDEETTKNLLTAANRPYGTKTVELQLTALSLAISDIYKAEEFLIEVEGHGRDEIYHDFNISRTVGWFTTIFPVIMKSGPNDLPMKIKAIKEAYRLSSESSLEHAIYCMRQDKWDQSALIRFNFLGEFQTHYDYFELSSDLSNHNNDMTSLIEMDSMIVENQLITVVRGMSQILAEDLNRLLEYYHEMIQSVVHHCMNKVDVDYSPSDFSKNDISQIELDLLFSES
ncbi:amino acid adenylation domain-containing protein [Paenibacillus sp.]|jgi:amino acid adenylation domain-containing protein/non-ribosomal peptide synthase protein (TIGR01720 family)|uniref:amino acid adenylation domain-containing protein n=1 Tax=Paenibacillus sp. TaxID=58172 RepID=UPI002827D307|nr:amino acid adenylation domain-containing protein [Paenibacillus sp.]MDR0268848.1 amino acid adenylation domain-containing protein [Paenibacillus sp.]